MNSPAARATTPRWGISHKGEQGCVVGLMSPHTGPHILGVTVCPCNMAWTGSKSFRTNQCSADSSPRNKRPLSGLFINVNLPPLTHFPLFCHWGEDKATSHHLWIFTKLSSHTERHPHLFVALSLLGGLQGQKELPDYMWNCHCWLFFRKQQCWWHKTDFGEHQDFPPVFQPLNIWIF